MGYRARSARDCVGTAIPFACVLACLTPCLAWCQEKYETPEQTNSKITQLAEVARTHPPDVTVGAGDVLHIEVFEIPDLTREPRVSPGGDISYPPIPGLIDVQGLTPYEIQGKLEHLLIENGLISHPQVTVSVRELNSQPVSVVGAVARPQVIQITRPTTLIQVIAAAGGIAGDAGSVVMVTRPQVIASAEQTPAKDPPGKEEPKSNAGSQTLSIRLKDLLESGDHSFNIPIYAEDVVSVPRAGIFYVAGAVQQPGGFVLEDRTDRITTLKAMALAKGQRSTAKLNDSVVIRKDQATGAEQQIPVRLGDILARKKEDVYLLPNDVLFIPDSSAKKALYRTGEAALAITTGLTILRVGSR